MQTDTLLKYRDQVLIIDTKYYEKILRDHYDKAILHSENLYQIFTYVKNLDVTGSGKVLGLLLYARTDETISYRTHARLPRPGCAIYRRC